MAATTTKTSAKRSDPVSRHIDGARGRDQVSNKDPSRHYVFANRAHPSGEEYYRELGYVIEYAPTADKPGGVQLWRGKTSKPGEPIEQQGSVLMSIDLASYRAIVQGGDGDSIGQDGIDALERRIVNRDRHTVDGLRGFGNYVRIEENTTTGEQAVTA